MLVYVCLCEGEGVVPSYREKATVGVNGSFHLKILCKTGYFGHTETVLVFLNIPKNTSEPFNCNGCALVYLPIPILQRNWHRFNISVHALNRSHISP